MQKKQPPPPPFAGFPDGKRRFFRALAKSQDRDWFKAHKAEYERDWLVPMQSLLFEIREALVPLYAPLRLAPVKMFRIQRDVRFGKDKTPYKTSVSGFIPIVGPSTDAGTQGTALYLELGLEDFSAAGMWAMEREALARFRDAVEDDDKADELDELLAPLEAAGYEQTSGETLKTAPRGVDPAHPRIALLRRKGLAVRVPLAADASTRAFLTSTLAAAKKAAPLVQWLARTTR